MYRELLSALRRVAGAHPLRSYHTYIIFITKIHDIRSPLSPHASPHVTRKRPRKSSVLPRPRRPPRGGGGDDRRGGAALGDGPGARAPHSGHPQREAHQGQLGRAEPQAGACCCPYFSPPAVCFGALFACRWDRGGGCHTLRWGAAEAETPAGARSRRALHARPPHCPSVSVRVRAQTKEDHADIDAVLAKMPPPRGDCYSYERGE